MFLAAFNDGSPEIFHTLQGEGPSAGAPAVFIRASRCNLHCVWCDSEYTWNFTRTPWPHRRDPQPGGAKVDPATATCEMSPATAAARILACRCPRVVITGGEPMLQEHEFFDLVRHIRAERPDTRFEVETNGTRRPSDDFAAAIDQFNVSPKLANSGVAASLRLQPAAIEWFAASPKAWFKFVLTGPDDLEEIQALRRRFAIPRERILLMPEGRTPGELERNAPWVANVCRDLGIRYCDRLHVRLWGDQRGV